MDATQQLILRNADSVGHVAEQRCSVLDEDAVVNVPSRDMPVRCCDEHLPGRAIPKKIKHRMPTPTLQNTRDDFTAPSLDLPRPYRCRSAFAVQRMSHCYKMVQVFSTLWLRDCVIF